MEPELTNVAMGQKYGVSERSVRRHRKALRDAVEVPEDAFLKELGVDPATVTARGYTRRLIDGYGHIDCILGRNAVVDVFPHILAHLEPTA